MMSRRLPQFPRSIVRPQLRPQLRASAVSRFAGTRRHASQASRIERITSKLPRWLQKYTHRLRNAPVSHVVSFLILHEITAIVPLIVFFALFHYTTVMPVSWITGHLGDYLEGGVTRFEKYFRRKEMFGFSQDEPTIEVEQAAEGQPKTHAESVMRKRNDGDAKYEILAEVALSYALTKALLPVRIIGSVWATPWLARIMVKAKSFLIRK